MDIVRSSVDQIIRFGRVIRPILGISFAPDQSSEQVSVSSLHHASQELCVKESDRVLPPVCCTMCQQQPAVHEAGILTQQDTVARFLSKP